MKLCQYFLEKIKENSMNFLTTRNLILLLLASSLSLVGCGSSSKKSSSNSDSSSSVSEDNAANLEFEVNGDSDSGKAGGLRTVYFGFNSSRVSSSTRDALTQNAEFLKENEDTQIQVEGHCDERGGVEYNLALGERRAQAVKQYLMTLGVAESRISTVSYGKERPVAFGHEEESWSQNRRANFVVVSK